MLESRIRNLEEASDAARLHSEAVGEEDRKSEMKGKQGTNPFVERNSNDLEMSSFVKQLQTLNSENPDLAWNTVGAEEDGGQQDFKQQHIEDDAQEGCVEEEIKEGYKDERHPTIHARETFGGGRPRNIEKLVSLGSSISGSSPPAIVKQEDHTRSPEEGAHTTQYAFSFGMKRPPTATEHGYQAKIQALKSASRADSRNLNKIQTEDSSSSSVLEESVINAAEIKKGGFLIRKSPKLGDIRQALQNASYLGKRKIMEKW